MRRKEVRYDATGGREADFLEAVCEWRQQDVSTGRALNREALDKVVFAGIAAKAKDEIKRGAARFLEGLEGGLFHGSHIFNCRGREPDKI